MERIEGKVCSGTVCKECLLSVSGNGMGVPMGVPVSVPRIY
jgi:hypothetical protein